MKSRQWQFNLFDVKRVTRNAFIFLWPVVAVELGLILQGITEPREYMIALVVWVLGVGTDIFRKLEAGK